MKMQESGQDYLEAILILSNEGKNVRAVDICEYFGYARATVSIFLKQLRENGYVKIAEHNEILLTDKGKEIANEVYEKHSILSQILKSIDVSEKIAIQDACRIEHYISDETFEALKKHFNIYDTKSNPHTHCVSPHKKKRSEKVKKK